MIFTRLTNDDGMKIKERTFFPLFLHVLEKRKKLRRMKKKESSEKKKRKHVQARVWKRREHFTNKTNWSAEGRNETQMLSFLLTYSERLCERCRTYWLLFFFFCWRRSCIVRRYSTEIQVRQLSSMNETKKIHSESISVAIEGVDIIFLSNFPFFFVLFLFFFFCFCLK